MASSPGAGYPQLFFQKFFYTVFEENTVNNYYFLNKKDHEILQILFCFRSHAVSAKISTNCGSPKIFTFKKSGPNTNFRACFPF